VGSKRERQADRALVVAYHDARLAELLEHVVKASISVSGRNTS
jgi:hypothetical protein